MAPLRRSTCSIGQPTSRAASAIRARRASVVAGAGVGDHC
jgi:hypothetical protein